MQRDRVGKCMIELEIVLHAEESMKAYCYVQADVMITCVR